MKQRYALYVFLNFYDLIITAMCAFINLVHQEFVAYLPIESIKTTFMENVSTRVLGKKIYMMSLIYPWLNKSFWSRLIFIGLLPP